MVLKTEQERIRCLITEALRALCENGLAYDFNISVQALIGITVDESDLFLVDIKELISKTIRIPEDHQSPRFTPEKQRKMDCDFRHLSPRSQQKWSKRRRKSSSNGVGENIIYSDNTEIDTVNYASHSRAFAVADFSPVSKKKESQSDITYRDFCSTRDVVIKTEPSDTVFITGTNHHHTSENGEENKISQTQKVTNITNNLVHVGGRDSRTGSTGTSAFSSQDNRSLNNKNKKTLHNTDSLQDKNSLNLQHFPQLSQDILSKTDNLLKCENQAVFPEPVVVNQSSPVEDVHSISPDDPGSQRLASQGQISLDQSFLTDLEHWKQLTTWAGPRVRQCMVCGYQSSHSTNMEKHIYTHTGYKPFVCSLCGKGFANKSNLNHHLVKTVDGVPSCKNMEPQ